MLPSAIFRLALSLAVLLALPACAPPGGIRKSGQFIERSVEVAGKTRRYQVFVPATAGAGRRSPVILFLHGAGERGDDNQRQVMIGLGPYARAHAADFPAIVVFPQSRENGDWGWDPENSAAAFAALEAATSEFGGDRDRTYLTGVSMGGFGTWALARERPDLFAALVPVCGGIARDYDDAPYADVARQFRDTPIRIFHGARDEVVSPEYSRRMAQALREAGARDARYTEFPDADHNAWDAAYATQELWTWLFAQRRR
jgi:predicted peptidase